MTSECVDLLIKNFSGYDIRVAIVDNGSNNGSGEQLRERYAKENKVNVIIGHDNLGFAKGNNIGYGYLKKSFNPDFIVVMNNDVLIYDDCFLDKILYEFNASAFAVLGPDIFSTRTFVHQSPLRPVVMTLSEVKRMRELCIEMSRHFLYRTLTWNFKLKCGIAKKKSVAPDYDIPHVGCVLQGACLIFSKDFISSREYAFNPLTFLYVEEDILAYECVSAGLVIKYSPELKVIHLEDVSTKYAMRSYVRREKMKYRRMAESMDVLIDLMNNG